MNLTTKQQNERNELSEAKRTRANWPDFYLFGIVSVFVFELVFLCLFTTASVFVGYLFLFAQLCND